MEHEWIPHARPDGLVDECIVHITEPEAQQGSDMTDPERGVVEMLRIVDGKHHTARREPFTECAEYQPERLGAVARRTCRQKMDERANGTAAIDGAPTTRATPQPACSARLATAFNNALLPSPTSATIATPTRAHQCRCACQRDVASHQRPPHADRA